ncbi:hypothetical protein MLD52_14480 [Puniceicoccaceae bacterium K14]|nr:hypothetical protein [Puniceicoccaceae bacterium K14]
MSLINQALKKEQVRRSGQSDLGNTPLPPAHRALVKKQRGNRNTKIVVGVCSLGLVLLVGITFLSITGMKRIIEETPTPKQELAGTQDSGIKAITDSTASMEQKAANGNSGASSTSTSIAQTTLQEPSLESAPAVEEEIIPPPPPLPKPDPATQRYLEDIQFQAVRMAEEQSRLLLDGRVYQIGNLIGEVDNPLLFKGVEGTHLVFQDKNGALYKIRG